VDEAWLNRGSNTIEKAPSARAKDVNLLDAVDQYQLLLLIPCDWLVLL